MKKNLEFLQETSTQALVKAINNQLDAELEKAILEGKDYLVWTQPYMHDIEYDLRGIKNARKEGQTHLVWEDLDGNTIKVNLRRLDEK
jgi:hypothetical protein